MDFIILVFENKQDTIGKTSLKKKYKLIQASGFWILQ